ncbi:MAG: S1 RNA-binding domain-containing protein, partial [Alphaproteobacteria bacterium]
SEMSWTKKNVDPGKIVSTSQQVEVIVLDVDAEKRRISLGLKQCQENPWEAFREKHPVGSEVEGTVKNITEFGLFVGLESDIDGMVHMSDISWDRPGEEAIADYKKGSRVKAKVLDVDLDKERISLGIKQLTVDSFAKAVAKLKRGDIVTCVVTAVQTNGVEVAVNEGAPGFVRKSDLSRDRADQRPEKFAVGDKLDGKITSIDRTGRRLTLSIKALEFAQEKEAMAAFGSSDSGASLGDILGPAISSATRRAEAEARAAQGEKATKAEEAPAGADEPARGKAEERAGAGRKEKPKKVKKAIKAEPAPAGADEPARGKADGEGGDAGAEPAAEDEGSRRGTEEGEAESEPAASTTKEENEKEGKA